MPKPRKSSREEGKNSRQEAGFGPVAAGMEAAVSGVEIGLDGHKEEGAYDADAEVKIGQGCADIAGEWSGLMKVGLGISGLG